MLLTWDYKDVSRDGPGDTSPLTLRKIIIVIGSLRNIGTDPFELFGSKFFLRTPSAKYGDKNIPRPLLAPMTLFSGSANGLFVYISNFYYASISIVILLLLAHFFGIAPICFLSLCHFYFCNHIAEEVRA